MSETQFLTIVKQVADKYGMEVKVNLKHHFIGFVGDYDIKSMHACEKELDEIFKSAGTIHTSRSTYNKIGNC